MTTRQNASDRLPADFIPLVYDLRLSLDWENDTFTGDVSITGDVWKPTDTLTLHVHKDLVLGTITVTQGGRTQKPLTQKLDESTDHLTLTFERKLETGPIVLRISPYTGSLNLTLCGLYKSTYTHGGKLCKLAVSQMEPVDARRVLPVRDQPNDKAVFNVTLDTPEHLVAISNGEIESERVAYGRKITTFSPTPKMASYLLAIIVGELECVEAKTKRGVIVRGWTTPGKKHLAKYSTEISVKIIELFEEYFGVNYPLPKLDQIAVPDFGFGAMENWGAIVYREVAMLVDLENCSEATLQSVTAYHTHEIAHQWYGDYVTMVDWSGLWLNESFATYIGTKCVAWLRPDWDVWTDFCTTECCRAMRLDGMRSTHPVEVPVPCSKDINEIFDAISYAKGGSLLRMLEQHIGENGLRDGMRLYMKRHAYGNTRTADLWNALEYATKKPVTELMTKWVGTPGYPVVEMQTMRKKNDLHLQLSQRRFMYDGSSEDGTWNIPVSVRTGTGEYDYLLAEREGTLIVPDHYAKEHGPAWLHPNAGRAGFYRAKVSTLGDRSMLRALDAGLLSPPERLGIEDDAYALCRASVTDIANYLDTVAHFSLEKEAAVWDSLLGNLGSMLEMLCGHPAERQALRKFCGELVSAAAERAGWSPAEGVKETSSEMMARPSLLAWAGLCGDENICEQADKLFAKTLVNTADVDANLRSTVYQLAAQASRLNRTRFDELMRVFHEASEQEEQVRILMSLGCLADADSLERAYGLVISDTVRKQDAFRLLAALRANPSLPAERAWNFVKANWSEIKKRYEGNSSLIGYFVTSSTGALATTEAADDIESFFKATPTEGLTMTVAQCAEKVRLNATWLERNLPILQSWMESKTPEACALPPAPEPTTKHAEAK